MVDGSQRLDASEGVPLPGGSRDKILDVAEALFARRGFAGVGLREVAEAAGLGKSSLFHHFRSKAELYLAVMSRALERIQEHVAPSLGSGGAPLERLDRCLDALIDALAEHAPTARLLLRGLFEDDDFDASALPEARAFDRNLTALLEGIGALLEEGIRAGVFRRVSRAHMLQTLIGATVYHFASGEFGEGLLGRPLFSSHEVRRRKHELKELLHRGLAMQQAPDETEDEPWRS